MRDVIEVKNDEYHFKYIDVKTPFEPSPSLELFREMEYLKIKQRFRSVITNYGLRPKKRKLVEVVSRIMTGHILSVHSGVNAELEDGFFHCDKNIDVIAADIEYFFVGVSKELAKKISDEINVVGMFRDAVSRMSTVVKKSKVYKKTSVGVMTQFNSLGLIKHTLNIPTTIYKNLEKRYREYKVKHKHKHKFDDLVYTLLLRYNTFDSGGQQWGMPYVIREKFRRMGFNFECFASALNHYYYYYCSMFYDIEKYFMSLGPFQNIEYIRGVYMANPPYELNVLNRIVTTFTNALAKSRPLVFMYGLPDWEMSGEKFYFMDESRRTPYHKYHVVFESYVHPWHDFMNNNMVMKIPSSYRFVLANTHVDVEKIKEIIEEWRWL